ncbi:MAG TPA: hypothetical protein VFL13_02585 [Candidatus Baltobacteraceae bacterium]|nr:hypothetical protein [Candidatus Baltobacteraceae bacterium]
MKGILKFVTGNSVAAPVGVALAAAAAVAFRHSITWIGLAYVAVLVVTLAISTFERV